MPNNIISHQDGSYLSTTFTGSNGGWKLIESESTGDSAYSKYPLDWRLTQVAKTLDTFTNGKGLYITKTRLEIYKWAEDKKIS